MSESKKVIDQLMANISKIPISKLTVKVFYDAKNRSSFCWRYFGNLVLKEGYKKKIINSERVYCGVCLDVAKADSEDILLGSIKIKFYSLTVSTGNMTRHLKEQHKIFDKGGGVIPRRRRSPPPLATAEPDQFTLAKDLALFCCRSLIPFDSICGKGMGAFFLKCKVIGVSNEMPPRHAISGEALTQVYEGTLRNVRAVILEDQARHGALAFELWTDVYKKLDYVTFTLHYLTNDFEMKVFNLSTLIVTGDTAVDKGERIKGMAEGVFEIFGMTDKNIHAVTTAGAIERHAASQLSMPQHLCLGHGLQSLIWIDGINEVKEIKQLVTKLVAIVKIVVYRMNDIEAEDVGEQVLLDSLCKVVDGLHYSDLHDENTSPILTLCVDPLDDTSEGLTEIKIEPEVSTPTDTDSPSAYPSIHWYNIFYMAIRLLQQQRNQVIINNILKRLSQQFTITSSEWMLLAELSKILSKFKEAVTIISSQTCTLNVALVFRSEIIDILEKTTDDESIFMCRFKRSMLLNINKRFPVTKPMVAAALLDCRFMALKEVDSYLESQNITRESFLASSIKETVKDDEIPDIKPTPSSSSSSSLSNCIDSSILLKLSQKHRGESLPLQDDIVEQECWRYLASADPKDPKDGDLLSFWKKRQDTFPWLSAFAKAILCIPATSSPCDSVFFGNSPVAKWSRLSPTHMNKVIFVHNNFKYCD